MTDRPTVPPLGCDEVADLAAGFVLGALDPATMDAVRIHLAMCPEAHPEFDELGGVVPYLADSLEPLEPPAALGSRIAAAVAAEAASSAASAAAPPAPMPARPPAAQLAPAAVPPAPVVDLATERRRRNPLVWIAALAAVLVIAALGAWNVSLRQDLSSAEAYNAAVDRVLALAGSPGGSAAILAPTQPGGPSGIAAIGADGHTEIAMRGLAQTSGSEVYEAWVVGSDGVPVAIGSFTPNAAGFGTLATASSASGPGVTIGLTREPTPGRTVPTPPMLSSGVASGST